MSPNDGLYIAPLIAYVSIVALVDVRTHRIPNALSATAAVVALSLQIWSHGGTGVFTALGGAAVGLSMFLPFYALRAFGAGDVKAMATIGIFLGAKLTLLAAALTLVAGAIIGTFVLLLNGSGARPALHRLLGLVAAPPSILRNRHNAPSPQRPRRRFPYGTAIAVGTFVTLLAMEQLHLSF